MITFHCLECDEDLAINDAVTLGQKISCMYCSAEFEVVAVDPLEVDWADEEEDQELAPLLDDEVDLLDDDLVVGLEDDDDTPVPLTARTSGKTARKQRAPAELEDDLVDVVPALEEDEDELDEELDDDWEEDEGDEGDEDELSDDDDEWEWDLDDDEDRWS
ncbi:MAG: hypothetical protein WDZ49_02990 [Litorilinea sp.]